MKLNEIDFDSMSNKELIQLSLKYKIIQKEDLYNISRKQLLRLIKQYIYKKLKVYGTREKEGVKTLKQRRNSISGSLQTSQDRSTNLPRVHKQRRMSEPITRNEVSQTKRDNQVLMSKQESNREVIHQMAKQNPEYDLIGMYPPVRRLVAIGDLHGDLRVTVMALQLAEVIPQNTSQFNLDEIHWCGGSTWIIQLGDQIDRCRPDDWKQNCIKDFSDVTEDEGNNMKIIKLLLRLDDEAKKQGGRVLGTLGNHELMNVDKDFRYVSPKEFLEFVPQQDRKTKYTEDGYPLGYYHRKKAFERGGTISKMYSTRKKSVIIVGSYLFVHGGISIDLAEKYTLPEINKVVSKWLTNSCNPTEEQIFDEIFRDDDDMSPFWCRILGEDYEDNNEKDFNQLLQILNHKNKLLTPLKGLVVAHTPQFMDGKYLNSRFNDRLWRIDVGMSRAFGSHNQCSEDKYRQIQVLVIHNDSKFEVRKRPYNSERYPSANMGQTVDLSNQHLPF